MAERGVGLSVQAVVNNLGLILLLLAVLLFKPDAQDVHVHVISNFHDCQDSLKFLSLSLNVDTKLTLYQIVFARKVGNGRETVYQVGQKGILLSLPSLIKA